GRRTCDAARGADGLGAPKALHARVELAPAQTEQLGRPGLVLAGLFEGALDERALDRLEVHPVRREVSACRVDGQGDQAATDLSLSCRRPRAGAATCR